MRPLSFLADRRTDGHLQFKEIMKTFKCYNKRLGIYYVKLFLLIKINLFVDFLFCGIT